SKWKRELIDISRLNEYQLKHIKKAASLVRPEGYLVYSTCSIEPEENFGIVEKFLNENPDDQLISAKGSFPDELIDENGCIQTYRHRHQMDGAFAAKIQRIK